MISAIVIAAGESRRMGNLKQLLPWGKNWTWCGGIVVKRWKQQLKMRAF